MAKYHFFNGEIQVIQDGGLEASPKKPCALNPGFMILDSILIDESNNDREHTEEGHDDRQERQ